MVKRRIYKLCNVGCSFLSGFALKSSDYMDSGIPVIKIGNIQDRRVEIDFNGNFVSDTILNEKVSRYLLNNNDILIAMTGQGSVGRVGKMKLSCGQRAILNQRVGKFICDEIQLNRDYLFYVLSSDKFQDYLFKSGSGSGQPNLSPEVILETEIPWVEYQEQRAIASVLSSLDDKIDLLHRQNKTLEALAETLFRQWFVEEAESTWSEGRITDLIEINPTRKLPSKTIAPYLEMSNVNESAYHPKNWYDREFTSGTKFINGDTLLARITPCLENGKTTYVDFLSTDTVGWGSTEFIVMHTKQHIHPFISYLFAKDEDFRNHAISSMSGSSGRQRVDIASLTDYEVMIPPDENIRKLNDFVEPIVMKLGNNSRQIRTLESLRDTLLPKLMSGEVRVQYNEQEETGQKKSAAHNTQQELPFEEAITAT